jgi:hypothetical protein
MLLHGICCDWLELMISLQVSVGCLIFDRGGIADNASE